MRIRLSIIFIALYLCLNCTSLLAQRDIPIGAWRTYASFERSLDVTQSTRYVYSASENGLVRIDKEDQSITTFSKEDGLNDADLIHVAYDSVTNQIVILYANGNIDIMTDQGVINIPLVLNNPNIQQSKAANQLRLDGRGMAYIAYDFGLVQLDLNTLNFGFTLRTTFAVHDFVRFQDRYFIATDDGLYSNSAAENVNHADIGTWQEVFEDIAGIPSRAVASYRGRLLADIEGDIHDITNGGRTLWLAANEGYTVRTISPMRNAVTISYRWIGDNSFMIDQTFIMDDNGTVLQAYLDLFCSIVMNDMVETATGQLYWANVNQLKFSEGIGQGCQDIMVEGPPTSDAFEIDFRGQEVIVATGTVTDRNLPTFNTNGLYRYLDGSWDQFNHEDAPFGDTVLTYIDITVGPQGQLAIGTFFDGLITVSPDGSDIRLYNRYNSCVEGQELQPDVQGIYDMKYDRAGRLWFTNFRAREPLKVIDTDGTCRSMSRSRFIGVNELSEFAIDRSGYKWIANTDDGAALTVYDEGELDDPNDDRFRTLNTSNSAILDNLTWDVAMDLNGDIWVGTDQGVVVFDCPSVIFDGQCFGRQPIVEVDGVAARLLENERVRTIAIDGANRKWFGTSNGVFVQSASGEEEVLRFDVDNSPLPSNFIRDININPTTGEVFIATDRGLVSYRSTATSGTDVHQPESEVFAFPNPVRPDYDGPIAVRGLPANARVKITDIQGKLMFDGRATGGQAIWDGRDYTGRRAASGVYLVFSTSETDDFNTTRPDALVSKILIVR